MSHTWQYGKTTFIGNPDLSEDIELIQEQQTLAMIPGKDLAAFMRDRFIEAIDAYYNLYDM